MFTEPMMLTAEGTGGGGPVWVSSTLTSVSSNSYSFLVTIHNDTGSAIAWDCSWTGDSGTVAANSFSSATLQFFIDEGDVLSGSFVAEMTAGGQTFTLFSKTFTPSLGLAVTFVAPASAIAGSTYGGITIIIRKSGSLTDGVVSAYNVVVTLSYGDGNSESWYPGTISGTSNVPLAPSGNVYATAGTYQVSLTLTATDTLGGTTTTITEGQAVEVESDIL